ncbi:caspase family protein [Rhodoblastus sp.]|uniref:caspase family protein n=1 Tax=Rhodoblastus sp. TaxID=1962975 RepID=UPI0026220E41|nr:caspase family protein [Rhodoblastus sp.]
MRFSPLSAIFGAFALLGALTAPLSAQQLERRIALVLGEGAYANGALVTGPNDAGLVAQTLQSAGFDVTGARDLDTQGLRDALREFIEKAQASGPDTVAMIYFAGYGLQSDGENYLAGVDAEIDNASDVAINTVRVSDYLKPLAALPLKARIVVLDAARKNPFAASGQPLAGGLALIQPDDGTLIAFNAAPGTIGPEESGPYGVYARALVEMIKAGGAPVNEMFDRVRMRVSEATKGGQIPWSASRISAPIVFLAHTAEAPADQRDQFAELTTKPVASFNAEDAFQAALARDTLQGYEDFLAAFPNDPLAARVRAIVAARREAMIWRETVALGTSRAYWSYLSDYPHGCHAFEARRALRHLDVAVEPPASYEAVSYDVPPPPAAEIVYVSQPVVYFDDPVWAFAPPPPPAAFYFGPAPFWFAAYPPPPPPLAAFVLPIPTYYPVAAWVGPPAYVAPAPANIYAANIHNTVVVNNVTNSVTITNAAGQNVPFSPGLAATGAAARLQPGAEPLGAAAGLHPGAGPLGATALHPGVAAAAAALPAAIAARAAMRAAPGAATMLPTRHALPTAPSRLAPLAGPKAFPGPRGATTPHGRMGAAGGLHPAVSVPGHAVTPLAGPRATMPPPANRAAHTGPRTGPRFSAPHAGSRFSAPHAGPRFSAPQASPRFSAPHAGPRFSAPHAGQRFSAPRAGPRFSAPQAGPRFSAPRAGPRFAAPRAGQNFSAPRAGPRFSAPRFAAPRPAGPRPAGGRGGGGKPQF